MNPQKVEIKMLVAKDLGQKLEEVAESVEKEVERERGGISAHKESSKAVVALHKHIDKDLEDGQIDEILGEPLKIIQYTKRYISRAVGVIDNLATQAEITMLRKLGRIDGVKKSVEIVKKAYDEERSKLENFQKAVESGEVRIVDGEPVYDNDARNRIPGMHPGLPIKAQRQAEEKKESESDNKVVELKQRKPKPRAARKRGTRKKDGKDS